MDVIDRSNFKQFIIDSPNQFKTGIDLGKKIKLEGKFDNIVVSGMGGSALPANLLRTYCNSLFKIYPDYKPFEIYINRFYSLPLESYFKKNLNFIASYSGNTEETISSFTEALKNNLPCIGFSSGGKVREICINNNIPHVKIPIPFPNFQPRMGTGYFFGSMLQIIINHGLLPDVTSEIIKSAEKLKDRIKNLENKGKLLAKKLKGKTPVIFSSQKYEPLAMVWKIKINENAKTPAFWNFLPEANHNEMVGYTNPQGKFFLILLLDPSDDSRNRRRYEATASLIHRKGIDSEIIKMEGENVFEKIFLSIYLSDWTSYYLALSYNQDPTPVELVEELKKILAS